MNDEILKKYIGFALDNRDMLHSILCCFQGEDIRAGRLSVPDSLINETLRPLILTKAGSFLRDYHVTFTGGSILLDLMINTAGVSPVPVGDVTMTYLLTIQELQFGPAGRQLTLRYQEDVKAEGGVMQNMAIRAFLAKGPLLATALSLAKSKGKLSDGLLDADKDTLVLQLSRITALEKLPESLVLQYLSCDSGRLKLHFRLLPEPAVKSSSRPKVQGGHLKDILNNCDRL